MKNKNIKTIIYGCIFNDIRVNPFFKKKTNSSVQISKIKFNYGGVFNLFNLKIRDEIINIYHDGRETFKKRLNYTFTKKFKKVPQAVIIEKKQRISFVEKGILLKKSKKIFVKKNDLYLFLYAECFPDYICNLDGKVVMDYNHSGFIIPKKLLINNLKNTNYLLGSIGELKWFFDLEKNFFFKNLTIIEHDPKKYILSFPLKNHKRKKIKLLNGNYKKNIKMVTGLGDMFALYFLRNIPLIKDDITNIKKVSKSISKWLN